jgi:hypothetical protein
VAKTLAIRRLDESLLRGHERLCRKHEQHVRSTPANLADPLCTTRKLAEVGKRRPSRSSCLSNTREKWQWARLNPADVLAPSLILQELSQRSVDYVFEGNFVIRRAAAFSSAKLRASYQDAISASRAGIFGHPKNALSPCARKTLQVGSAQSTSLR